MGSSPILNTKKEEYQSYFVSMTLQRRYRRYLNKTKPRTDILDLNSDTNGRITKSEELRDIHLQGK